MLTVGVGLSVVGVLTALIAGNRLIEEAYKEVPNGPGKLVPFMTLILLGGAGFGAGLALVLTYNPRG